MDKEELKRLAKSDKYIPGIYNYCDRWCEKCSYTKKCLSFEMSKSQFDSNISINNKKFWTDLEKSFGVVKELLNDYMEEYGIEPPSEEDNSKIEIEMKRVDEYVKSDPIIKESRLYTKVSGELLKEYDYFSNSFNTATKDKDKLEQIGNLQEAIEIILFYNSLIFVKLSRALHAYYSNDVNDATGMEEDQLVSARIALSAVEKSMGAWHFILDNFDTNTDKVADIILHLNQIKLGVETTIPKVVGYKRPYFD